MKLCVETGRNSSAPNSVAGQQIGEGRIGFAAGPDSFEREGSIPSATELAREAPLRTWIVSDALRI